VATIHPQNTRNSTRSTSPPIPIANSGDVGRGVEQPGARAQAEVADRLGEERVAGAGRARDDVGADQQHRAGEGEGGEEADHPTTATAATRRPTSMTMCMATVGSVESLRWRTQPAARP
jgi:hypothetical protein